MQGGGFDTPAPTLGDLAPTAPASGTNPDLKPEAPSDKKNDADDAMKAVQDALKKEQAEKK
jgi:hypothetical protein